MQFENNYQVHLVKILKNMLNRQKTLFLLRRSNLPMADTGKIFFIKNTVHI